MPIIEPAIALSTRQEAFCRHYTASGNAADAARQAGYSERSARQTGCALLERPYVIERLRRIRLSWNAPNATRRRSCSPGWSRPGMPPWPAARHT